LTNTNTLLTLIPHSKIISTDLELPFQDRVELTIPYFSSDITLQTKSTLEPPITLPSYSRIHKCRKSEFNQFVYLYYELGGGPTYLFAEYILKIITINRFEGESPSQFDGFQQTIIEFCAFLKSTTNLTEKFQKFLDYYLNEIKKQKGNILTILFLERIVAAGAINHYLKTIYNLSCEALVSSNSRSRFKYRKRQIEVILFF
jgi:hypothetical protein